MRKKSARAVARAAAAKPRRAVAKGTRRPLLERADVRTILYDLAKQVAPADVAELMRQEDRLRAKAAHFRSGDLLHLAEQLGLALDCLRDHLNGTCPQIPYYTVTLLAGAVRYFADEIDVIPDFLPHIGRLDDAAVMAMACQLGHDGLRRYCDWKGRDLDAVLGTSKG